MWRRVLLTASRSDRLRRLVTATGPGRAAATRFVPGESPDDVVRAARTLAGRGLTVTVDHVGEDTLDKARAAETRDAYLLLLKRLSDNGLSAGADLSVKLSAIGQALSRGGGRLALDHARSICAAAQEAGASLTLDMEDHTTTDATLETLRELRVDFPSVGVALQAYLRRTESDCRDLARTGSRVRLCKGAYAEPATVAHHRAAEVAAAYLRCLDVLLTGPGYPMIATHQPRLIRAASTLVRRHRRDPTTYEFQLLYGVRPQAERRLRAAGHAVRVYVPYGTDWYGYFMRRLAERPANARLLLRSLARRS
jgi:proline dehydrogenase